MKVYVVMWDAGYGGRDCDSVYGTREDAEFRLAGLVEEAEEYAQDFEYFIWETEVK